MKLNAIQTLYKKDCHQDEDGTVYIEGRKLSKNEEKEVAKEMKRLEAAYIEEDRKRKIKEKYPTVEEQLEMMYWDKKNDTDIWFETIDALKEQE